MRAIIFDFGNTLIYQQIDDKTTLDHLSLVEAPGASVILRSLATEYTLGLLTNTQTSREEQVGIALDKLGWREFFSAIVTSCDCGAKKPDPRMFLCMLKRLNVPPADALMVGNNPLEDIMAAANLGIRTAFYSVDINDSLELDRLGIKPDLRIARLSDLARIRI